MKDRTKPDIRTGRHGYVDKFQRPEFGNKQIYCNVKEDMKICKGRYERY